MQENKITNKHPSCTQDAKFHNKILTHQIQQYIKTVTYHSHIGLSQDCKVGLAFKNQLMLLNLLMDKKIQTTEPSQHM